MEKTYLAKKEKKIVDEAQEVLDFDVAEYAQENKSFFNKLSEAQMKIDQKMRLLNDYYLVWSAVKDIKYSEIDSKEAIDKKIYDLIFKTYKDLEKATFKFNEIKIRFDDFKES